MKLAIIILLKNPNNYREWMFNGELHPIGVGMTSIIKN